jgi:ubiquinol-cytochrome c reductase iron-sulfur subunit
MDDKNLKNPQRRYFIEKAAGITAGVGIAAATWPFIDSMNPTASDLSNATTRANIEAIRVGEVKTVEWEGKPIFIFHRTPEQIKKMQASMGSDIDPEPDADRVINPEWLIVIGLCTHLGCVPPKSPDGWICPCHGSIYDNSGRVLQSPAPKNLVVPPYKFVTESEILIGEA